MKYLRVLAVTIVVLAAALPAGAQQATTTSGSSAAAPSAAAALPAVRHLVYQFGYNTKAASEGTGTGTTTIDITGIAADGGMTVTATDDWWNTVNPRQTYTCEVYPGGGVTCAQPPYALSPIQVAVVPLLGQNYFTSAWGNPTSTWKQNYNVRATFDPSGSTGFAGEVNTWACAYTLVGKGTVPNGAPLILIHSEGAMKEQGGRAINVNQKANILVDPRIKMPVYVDEAVNLVPRWSVDQYTVELKLTKD